MFEVARVITAERPELVELFAGIPPQAFRKLVATVARRGGRQVADGVNGRQWSLPLGCEGRVCTSINDFELEHIPFCGTLFVDFADPARQIVNGWSELLIRVI